MTCPRLRYLLASSVIALTLAATAASSHAEFEVLISPTEGTTSDHFIWRVLPGELYRLDNRDSLTVDWNLGEEFVATGLTFSREVGMGGPTEFYRLVRLDRSAPQIASRFPDAGMFSVPAQSDVRVLLEDTAGVDPTSVSLTVGPHGPYQVSDPELSLTDGELVWTNPGLALASPGEPVDISLSVADVAGAAATFSWSAEVAVPIVPDPDLFVFGSQQAIDHGQQVTPQQVQFFFQVFGPYSGEPTSGNWRLLEINANGLILEVDTAQARDFLVQTLQADTPIANATPRRLEEFFHRRVVTVNQSPPNRLIVETQDVPIEYLFESYAYLLDENAVALETDDAGLFVFAGPPAGVAAFSLIPPITKEIFDFDRDFNLFPSGDGPRVFDFSDFELFQGNSAVNLTFDRLDFSIDVDGNVAGKWVASTKGNKNELEFYAEASVEIDAGAIPRFEVDLDGSVNQSIPLFKAPTITIPLSIGPVPMPITIDLGIDLEMDLSAQLDATLTGGFTYNRTTTYWVDFDAFRSGDKFQSGKRRRGPGFESVPVEVNAEGSLNARAAIVPFVEVLVGPRVDVLIASGGAAAGVRAQLELYGELEVDAAARTFNAIFGSDGSFEIDACLSAGVDWGLFGIYEVTFNVIGIPILDLDGETRLAGGRLYGPEKFFNVGFGGDWQILPGNNDWNSIVGSAYTPLIPTGQDDPQLVAHFQGEGLNLASGISLPQVLDYEPSGDQSVLNLNDFTVQWWKDGVPIPGANGQNLFLEETDGPLAGDYYAIATGPDDTEVQGPTIQVLALPDGEIVDFPLEVDFLDVLNTPADTYLKQAAVGNWNGEPVSFVARLDGDVDYFTIDSPTADGTVSTGLSEVTDLVAGSRYLVATGVENSGGNAFVKYIDAETAQVFSQEFVGLDPEDLEPHLSGEFLLLVDSSGSGPEVTVYNLSNPNPFSSPFPALLEGSGSAPPVREFGGPVSVDFQHPFLLVGVAAVDRSYFYRLDNTPAAHDKTLPFETFNHVAGGSDALGTQVYLLDTSVLIKGSGTRHQVYDLATGDLFADWDAAPGTTYIPSTSPRVLLGITGEGAFTLFDLAGTSDRGGASFSDITTGFTGPASVSWVDGGKLGLTCYSDGSNFSIVRYIEPALLGFVNASSLSAP